MRSGKRSPGIEIAQAPVLVVDLDQYQSMLAPLPADAPPADQALLRLLSETESSADGPPGSSSGVNYSVSIVGAPYADPHGSASGSAYVVFGKAGGFASSIDLSALNGTTGFRLDGMTAAYDHSGQSVSAAGDVNGDGFDDLVIGAKSGFSPGTSYVLFGGNFLSNAATDDEMTGSAAAERFVGGLGDDTLTGGGGADAFDGGAGNDVIAVADLGFQRADGGGNDDHLVFELAVGAAIDLSNISAKVQNVEQLDFRNTIANTISIKASDIIDLHVRNDDVGGVSGLDNAVTVLGDGDDSVDLVGAFTLESGGSPPGFDVYHFDAAPEVKLVIQQGVTVI